MKKIYYGKAVYDNKEINAVIKVLKNSSLTLIDGEKVKLLEKTVCKIFGKKYGLMVNSGSSANLLALSSFNFKKGSEIITPNLTFSTTVAPSWYIGATVVEKVKFGVMISDPFLKLKDERANKLAEEPELTIRPYFLPKILHTVFSNSLTFSPSIRDRLLFLRT